MYLTPRFGVASLSLSLSAPLFLAFRSLLTGAPLHRGALSAARGTQNSLASRETIGAPDAADPLARAAASRVNTYALQAGL